jgi:hypothetical protein
MQVARRLIATEFLSIHSWQQTHQISIGFLSIHCDIDICFSKTSDYYLVNVNCKPPRDHYHRLKDRVMIVRIPQVFIRLVTISDMFHEKTVVNTELLYGYTAK